MNKLDEENLPMRVLISSLFFDTSQEAFTPYVYGLLRAACDQDAFLKQNIVWEKPLYKLDFSDENVIEKYLDSLSAPPDLLGISCYSWNTNFQIKLAKITKEKFPKTLIVMGGLMSPRILPTFLTNIHI